MTRDAHLAGHLAAERVGHFTGEEIHEEAVEERVLVDALLGEGVGRWGARGRRRRTNNHMGGYFTRTGG